MVLRRRGGIGTMSLTRPSYPGAIYDNRLLQPGIVIQIHYPGPRVKITYLVVSAARIVRDPVTQESSRCVTVRQIKSNIFGKRKISEEQVLDLSNDMGMEPYVDYTGAKWWSTQEYTTILRQPRR